MQRPTDPMEAYKGDQDLPLARRGRQEVWGSVKTTLALVASSCLAMLAIRNSLTYHLQHFWGASGDFWQQQWDKIVPYFHHDQYNLMVWGTALCAWATYWGVGTLYTLVDLLGIPTFLQRYKMQPGTNTPVEIRPLIQCILWVNFNQIIPGSVCSHLFYQLMCLRGFDDSAMLPSFHRVLLDFVVFILVEEVGFYYTHRMFHHQSLYRHIHKRHHQWRSPIAIAALYAHPVEHVVSSIAPVLLGPVVMGSHAVTTWLWVMLATLSILNAHSGYHLPFFPSPEAHDYHHIKFNQCYGVLGVLDTLHGTNTQFRASSKYPRHATLFSFAPLVHDAKGEGGKAVVGKNE